MVPCSSTLFCPFRVGSHDNPETVRLRKYATGAHLALRGAPIAVGRTPKQVVWTEGKARLYRYRPDVEKRHPVPTLLVYALIFTRLRRGRRYAASAIRSRTFLSLA